MIAVAVLPVEQAGLHCGDQTFGFDVADVECSPSNRRGFIAAGNSRVLSRMPRQCSPSNRRGFIAARRGPAGSPRQPLGAPRRTGGASLRHVRPRTGPLPRSVLPVEQAGLHCGIRQSQTPHARQPRAPRRTGGASLRRGLQGREGEGRASAPRRTGGASLRPNVPEQRINDTGRCSPSNRRGFIAAPASAGSPHPTRQVLPVEQAGLHCGLRSPAITASSSLCSPSNRRGFIAASPLLVVVGAGDVCSPSNRRGFIAAREMRR